MYKASASFRGVSVQEGFMLSKYNAGTFNVRSNSNYIGTGTGDFKSSRLVDAISSKDNSRPISKNLS